MHSRLELSQWDLYSHALHQELAAEVARAYPQFRLLGIERCSQGNQSHDVAFYRFQNAKFALIPVAYAKLGHDPRWIANGEELEEWKRFCSRAGETYRPLEEALW